jgi:ADP-ribosylglycohydrolase
METLEGLSVGDAIGEALSYQHARARNLDDFSTFGQGNIRFTDDTAMALGIVECLSRCKTIDPDVLAWIFARNYKSDPERGYGKMTRKILTQLGDGGSWRTLSASAFSGGSFGNGSAMRVGPLGAYFWDDFGKVCDTAAATARVTHFHNEGIAGAVAVAIATAAATRSRGEPPEHAAQIIWQSVLEMTPSGTTAIALKLASSLDTAHKSTHVAKIVGCGYDVSCQDTVPFAIWNACRCLSDFQEALLSTVEVGGDCDTNAAIVCGIVASYGTSSCIPEAWRRARERLQLNIA